MEDVRDINPTRDIIVARDFLEGNSITVRVNDPIVAEGVSDKEWPEDTARVTFTRNGSKAISVMPEKASGESLWNTPHTIRKGEPSTGNFTAIDTRLHESGAQKAVEYLDDVLLDSLEKVPFKEFSLNDSSRMLEWTASMQMFANILPDLERANGERIARGIIDEAYDNVNYKGGVMSDEKRRGIAKKIKPQEKQQLLRKIFSVTGTGTYGRNRETRKAEGNVEAFPRDEKTYTENVPHIQTTLYTRLAERLRGDGLHEDPGSILQAFGDRAPVFASYLVYAGKKSLRTLPTDAEERPHIEALHKKIASFYGYESARRQINGYNRSWDGTQGRKPWKTLPFKNWYLEALPEGVYTLAKPPEHVDLSGNKKLSVDAETLVAVFGTACTFNVENTPLTPEAIERAREHAREKEILESTGEIVHSSSTLDEKKDASRIEAMDSSSSLLTSTQNVKPEKPRGRFMSKLYNSKESFLSSFKNTKDRDGKKDNEQDKNVYRS